MRLRLHRNAKPSATGSTRVGAVSRLFPAVRQGACAVGLLAGSLFAAGTIGSATAQAPAPAQSGSSQTGQAEIAGLWSAKKRFGPDVRGTLIVVRTPRGFEADIAGWRVPVATDGPKLTFALPGARGEFAGELRGSVIVGHWARPGTPVNSSRYVSPVRLTLESEGQWKGEVVPLADEFTLYVLIARRPDGTLSATLGNPERDLGSQSGVDQVTVSGTEIRLLGHRGGKERVVASGTYDAAESGFTLVFPSRGGTYDFTRDTDFSAFYPRGKFPPRYAYAQPIASGDGWPVAAADRAGLNRRGIENLIQSLSETPVDQPRSLQLHGLLIARHGKLIVDEYFHGQRRDRLHETRSGSKSMVSVLMGAAMQAGLPISLSTPVYATMGASVPTEGLDAQKSRMQLKHLLTMSSGYFCDDANEEAPGNETVMTDQTEEPDWYKYTLKVPLASTPGQFAVYCSSNPNLELGVLGRATGQFVPDLFDRLVAGPMQIRNFAWMLDPAGNPFGGGSIQFEPRDYLKFGQLMLNGGTWNGHRVLSKAYVADSVKPHCSLGGIAYGYHWWIEDFPYKNRTVRAFMASGAGGQIITVVPELDLVVETIAANYASRPGLWLGHEFVPEKVLPLVLEAGDDPTAEPAAVNYDSPVIVASERKPSTCTGLM